MLQALLDRVRQAHTAELEGGEGAEAGFTLIELMVVLLILAILMAIAIPTFLGVTSGANERAAQSNLTNAFTEASAVYQSNSQSFSGLTAGGLTSSAPEFTWTSGSSCSASASNCISFTVVDSADNTGQVMVLADGSKNNVCWYLLSVQQTPASGGVFFGTGSQDANITAAGTFYYKKTNTSSCNATDLTVAAPAGGSSYATAATAG